MPGKGGMSWGAKIMTSAAIALVLSFGLCGSAVPAASHSSALSGDMFMGGLVCLGLGVLLFVVGIIVLVVESSDSRRG
jgi:hypothetical protein